MFGKSGDIYTVHEKPEAAEPSDRIVLVREGFSFLAFLFNFFWLLYQRCWRMAALYLFLLVLTDKGGAALGLSTPTIGVMQFGLQLWLGFVANDCRRAALTRDGYEEVSIVCAESALLAERRYFDRLHYARAV